MRVEFHPDARAELEEDARWYEGRGAGLGDELRDEVFGVLAQIQQFPESFPRWPRTRHAGVIRKGSLRKFPYAVAYYARPNLIRVLAIAHAKRRPLYWLYRATEDPE